VSEKQQLVASLEVVKILGKSRLVEKSKIINVIGIHLDKTPEKMVQSTINKEIKLVSQSSKSEYISIPS